MATLRVSQVRDRVDAALQSADYHRSRHAPDLFGRDADDLLPESYSISTPSSTYEDFDGRENYGDEGEATTTLEVWTAYRLRSDDQSGDYGEALDHEHEVLKTVLQDTDRTYMQIQLVDTPQRTVSPNGDWLISRLRFRIFHRLSFR